jgi:hypothetical protein
MHTVPNIQAQHASHASHTSPTYKPYKPSIPDHGFLYPATQAALRRVAVVLKNEQGLAHRSLDDHVVHGLVHNVHVTLQIQLLGVLGLRHGLGWALVQQQGDEVLLLA